MDQVVKNLPAMQEIRAQLLDVPGSGTSPGGKNGNPLQYSCLENSIDRGAWCTTVHWITKILYFFKSVFNIMETS